MFGGPSWEWDARRRQYYLHNFLPEQPNLNVRNPAVQEALLDVARFWLERGVDGFRLDVVNFLIQDARLRDNPVIGLKRPPARPHEFQRHLYDRSQPEALEFVSRLRALAGSYPSRLLVGEIEDEEPLLRQREYTAGEDRLHTAYSFFLLRAGKASPALFREAMAGWEGGWPSWSLSNHDVPRYPTRLAAGDPRRVRLLMAILLCLQGTIFLYQGDELGLPQARVPFEKLRDPEAIRFWPEGIGRDGARTPMPWIAGEAMAGFTSAAEAWLPIDPRHRELAVDVQETDPGCMLAFTRKLIALRCASSALRLGDWRPLDAPEGVLAFERTCDAERVLCVFNLSDTETRFEDIRIAPAAQLETGLPARIEAGAAILPAFGGCLLRV
jgi:alpha-glucosidase